MSEPWAGIPPKLIGGVAIVAALVSIVWNPLFLPSIVGIILGGIALRAANLDSEDAGAKSTRTLGLVAVGVSVMTATFEISALTGLFSLSMP
jgi:hypothetical protein